MGHLLVVGIIAALPEPLLDSSSQDAGGRSVRPDGAFGVVEGDE